MQRSIISIRRAFTFHNNFYNNANQILSSTKQLFTYKHSETKKMSEKNKNTSTCTKSTIRLNNNNITVRMKHSLEDKKCYSRDGLNQNKLTDNSIFIGVHVR